VTQDKFEALINGQKIPRGRLAEMFDELTETCYEKTKHYRKFEGAESAFEWEEMEELLRRIQAILREGMPPSQTSGLGQGAKALTPF
jgi:hypothetical protein